MEEAGGGGRRKLEVVGGSWPRTEEVERHWRLEVEIWRRMKEAGQGRKLEDGGGWMLEDGGGG